MFSRFIKGALAGVMFLALQACQDKTAGGPDSAEAEPAAPPATVVPAGVFAPRGMEGATVIVRPSGNAEIKNVDGFDGHVARAPTGDQFSQIMLPPGKHILHVNRAGANQGLNLQFEAEAGDFFAAGVDYLFKGEKFWAPVIVKDSPDGTIVADKDGVLVGMTVADARTFIVSKLADAEKAKAAAAAEINPTVESENARVARIFDEGRKHFDEKKYSEALEKFDAVVAAKPDVDVAHLYRGLTLANLKRPNDALAALDLAVMHGRKKRKPDDDWFALPQYKRAQLLIVQKKYQAAEQAFTASIAAKPTVNALRDRGKYYLTRGQLLGKQEKWGEAAPWFKKAQADAASGITIDPSNGKLWSLKTFTHIMLNEHEDACKSMRKTCELGNCSILDQFPQCKPGGS